MKNGKCCKCQSAAVFQVDTFQYSNKGIPLGTWSEAGLTHYVCTKCGYTEAYVSDQKALTKIAKDKPYIEPRQ